MPTVQIANMERAACHEPLAAKEGAGLDKRKSIHVHSRRKRLADPDGISCKAVIDGLREAGILVDDNAKFISEVTHSQELSKDEETIITLTAHPG
jgi:Holliday junction resolvase RusA-like endonuclease